MLLGLVLAAVVAGLWMGKESRPAASPVTPITSTFATPSSESHSVHVSGWVVSPGVVALAESSIVADAIAAAGGARPGAALDGINLARVVGEGDQVHVPGPGQADAPDAVDGNGSVSLNRAGAPELEGLPGVGPVLAERIVAHREANGPFETVEGLLDVPGIGEAKLASLRDLVTLP